MNTSKTSLRLALRKAQFCLAGFCALILPMHLHAQTSVATEPVGFMQATLAPSPNGTTRVYTPVSLPLHATPTFVGSISAVSGNVITLSGTVSGNLTASPYEVHIKSAANSAAVGRSFLITSATTTSVTVDSPNFQVQTILAANDQVSIRAANTLGSFFGETDATVKLKTGETARDADIVNLWNGSSWSAYYYFTSYGWVLASDANYTLQNKTVIFPDEGMLVGRISTNVLPAGYATLVGSVPVNAQKAELSAPGTTFVANPLPTAITFAQFGFTNSSSWRKGETAGDSDLVYIWQNNSWKAFYYFTGYGWVRADDANYTIQDSFEIPAGAAVLVRRRDSVSGMAAHVHTALNYNLN